MKGRIYSCIVLALILVVSVASIFVLNLNNSFVITSSNGEAAYYTSKVAACLVLIVVGFLIYKKPYKNNMPFMMYGLAILFQFIPLGVRFLCLGDNPSIVFAWMLVLISLVVVIGLILVFEYISSKPAEAE